MMTAIQPSRLGGGDAAFSLAAGAHRRAFSLIEVLLAIFILGVGVISIAALFPAGIAQQRLSVDDVMGQTVANNALAILRSKVRPEYFGTFEEHGFLNPTIDDPPGTVAPRDYVVGDWPWRRPAFFRNDANLAFAPPVLVKRGSISIFTMPPGLAAGPNFTRSEIPWNTSLWSAATPPAPPIVITQRERYYPMAPDVSAASGAPRPQYVWDCMFRRFQGRVLVAIFVYRVSIPGGGNDSFSVPPNPNDPNDPPLPHLPIWLDLVQDSASGTGTPFYSAGGAWDTFSQSGVNPPNPAIVLGTVGGTAYNPDDPRQAWQEPRQWLLDQNNNIHRVLGRTRDSLADPVHVELVRPLTALPNLPAYWFRNSTPANQRGRTDLVTNIWYIPRSITDPVTNQTYALTPVYLTVREL